MINRIIIIVFIFCISMLNAQDNIFQSNIQVYYDLKFKSDSISSVFSHSNVDLYIGEKGSIYQVNGKRQLDSIIVKHNISKFPTKPIHKINHVIKKDYNNMDNIYTEMIEGINYGYIEDETIFKNWTLLPETKK